jgi:hypothetical protein
LVIWFLIGLHPVFKVSKNPLVALFIMCWSKRGRTSSVF